MINTCYRFYRHPLIANRSPAIRIIGRESFHQQTGINQKIEKICKPATFIASTPPNSFKLRNYLCMMGSMAISALCLWILSKKSEKTPTFSLEELEEHRMIEEGLWIAWQDPQDKQWYISAMADFVALHPGGEKITEAGGKAAMPYWQQFARHLDSHGNPHPQVLQALRERMIGLLKMTPSLYQGLDPYILEPDRSSNNLFPLQSKPYNAGQKSLNLDSFVTDISKMFIRFHAPAPLVQNHLLTIETLKKTAVFTLDTLKQYEMLTYTSILQCTGHRRSEMVNTNGIQWESAVANVEIKGYPLWDILHELGVEADDNQYLLAEQLDEKGDQFFSTCIPLKDLPKKTLLAIEMNGEVLTRDHGGPLRLWVPGFNGNFSVKKIDQIKICSKNQHSTNNVSKFQALGKWGHAISFSSFLSNYVEERKGELFFNPEIAVNSLVFTENKIPPMKETERVHLKGWAWSGGGREIASVQISTDEGQTWIEAALNPIIQQPVHERYAWTGWEISINASKKMQVWVRAKDSEGNMQPKESIWNSRGLRNNSWTKVDF